MAKKPDRDQQAPERFESSLDDLDLGDLSLADDTPPPDPKTDFSAFKAEINWVREDLLQAHQPVRTYFQDYLNMLEGTKYPTPEENVEFVHIVQELAETFGVALYYPLEDGSRVEVKVRFTPDNRFQFRTAGPNRQFVAVCPTWPLLYASSH